MMKPPRVDLREPLVAGASRGGWVDGWGAALVVVLVLVTLGAEVSALACGLSGRVLPVSVDFGSADSPPRIDRVNPAATDLRHGDVLVRLAGEPFPVERQDVSPGTRAWEVLQGHGPLDLEVTRATDGVTVHSTIRQGVGLPWRVSDIVGKLLDLATWLAQGTLALLAWRLRRVVSGARWMFATCVLLLLALGAGLSVPFEVGAWRAPHLWILAGGGVAGFAVRMVSVALLLPCILLITWILEDFPVPLDGTGPSRRVSAFLTFGGFIGLLVTPLAGMPDARGFWLSVMVFTGGMLSLLASVVAVILLLRAARHASRRLREGSLSPGALQQARIAFLSVQASLMLFLLPLAAWVSLDNLAIATTRRVLAAGDAMDAWAPCLLTLAFLLPPLGFILALRRQGLWQVPRARMLGLTMWLLLVGFGATWLIVGVLMDALLPTALVGSGVMRSVLSAAGSALVVAILRPPLERFVGNRWFPQIARFRSVVAREAERVAVAESPEDALGLVAKALEADLGVRPLMIAVEDPTTGSRVIAEQAGGTPFARVLEASAPLLASSSEAIVETDDGPLLVLRLGSPERRIGTIVLGPRRGGLAYNSRDRELLRGFANVASARLVAAR